MANNDQNQDALADLIRQKVEAAYAKAPNYSQEAREVLHEEPGEQLSRHQKFIKELVDSGKPVHEVQTAWHEYYAGLTDREKHTVWQEFYAGQGAAGDEAARLQHSLSEPATRRRRPPGKVARRIDKINPPQHLRSLAFGLSMGFLVLVVFMFSFFNERFIAPFIQPSRTATNIPIITSSEVSSSPELIIPKINAELPVVYGVDTINEQAVQNSLETGVVHYADTADPGQDGNGVIVGHSSNNILNPGKYKFAFVLLHDLDNGDTFYLQKDGKRYAYQVYKKEIVKPNDVSVLGLADKPATFSLITCDPPGTSNNRLVVIGQQISPDPNANIAASGQNSLAKQSAVIPGNSPSLWSRLVKLVES